MNEEMPLQVIDHSGFKVSQIALGCMGLAGTWNPAEVSAEHRRKAVASVEAALEVDAEKVFQAMALSMHPHSPAFEAPLVRTFYREYPRWLERPSR